MQMTDAKTALRKELTAVRRRLAAEGNQTRDAQILSNLVALDAYQCAEVLLCYHATAFEVGTVDLIRSALSDKKTVALPCCDPSTHTMSFYSFSDLSELVPSHYGICEPPQTPERLVTELSRAICIVPALSIDHAGNRLGYGGGYYDRFLAHNPSLMTIGLCYSECCRESIPAQIHDIPLRMVITEDGHRVIGQRRSLEENHAG